jgi:GntR family phosphonate transport system transcriptional regulator
MRHPDHHHRRRQCRRYFFPAVAQGLYMSAAISADKAVTPPRMSRQHGPVYQQLAQHLRQLLASYRPGEYLPSEMALAETYGVNRHTLRRAVEVLIDDGLLLRHKGRGSCVTARPIMYPVAPASTYSQVMRSQGYRPQARVLGRRIRAAKPSEADLLGLDHDARIFELSTVRLLDGQPMTLIRHCFSDRFAQVFQNYRSGSVREYLARQGWALIRQSTHIGAQMPTLRDALLLLMPRQVPLLSVHTVSGNAGGTPLELSVSLSRADRFQYHVDSGENNES